MSRAGTLRPNRVEDSSRTNPVGGKRSPVVRIGLHAADALRGRGGYRGKGVHVAARIAALAESGEILASSSTLARADRSHTLGEQKLVRLKGVAQPVEVAPVRWR